MVSFAPAAAAGASASAVVTFIRNNYIWLLPLTTCAALGVLVALAFVVWRVYNPSR